jgi:hypothetical protein
MLITILHALLFGLLFQQAPAAGGDAVSFARRLSGVWKAEETRNVTLTVQPSGQAAFSLAKAVVGRNGRRYAPSVVEATLKIGDPIGSAAERLGPTVMVVQAEERYLDGDRERWPSDSFGTKLRRRPAGPPTR